MSYLELTDVPKQSLDNTQEGTTWINVQGENNDDNEIMRAAVLCIGMQGSTEVQCVCVLYCYCTFTVYVINICLVIDCSLVIYMYMHL